MKKDSNKEVLVFLTKKHLIVSRNNSKKLKYSFQKNAVNIDNLEQVHKLLNIVLRKNCQISDKILLIVDSHFTNIKESLLSKEEQGIKTQDNIDANCVYKYFNLNASQKPVNEDFIIEYSSNWQTDFENKVVKTLNLDFENLIIIPEHKWLSFKDNIKDETAIIIRNNHVLLISYHSGKPVMIETLKDMGIHTLVGQIANYFNLPRKIAADLYLMYGNVLFSGNIKHVVIDINLPESEFRAVILSDLAFVVQQYFIALFKAISDLTKNKKNKVYKQNILLYGKFISHLSLNQLASMYFANNSKNMAYEYYGDFSIFEKFDFPVCKENTLETVLADTVTNLEKEKANKTIAKVSVNQRIGKFAKKLLNDWNSFFYETEIDTI